MTAGSAEAFAEELRRATAALEGIAEALDEAQLCSQEAIRTRKRLLALRERARLNTSRPLEAMADLRRDMRRARRSLRRPLFWRIVGLKLLQLWRLSRVALLVLLMMGLLLSAVLWVARNQDWIMERFWPSSGLRGPEEAGPTVTDPARPDPGKAADQAAAPPASPPTGGGQP